MTTSRRSFPILACLAALLAAPAGAQICEARFPMDVLGERDAGGALELALRVEELGALDASELATLTGVPLPGGSTADLDVRRIRFDDSQLELRVDGVPARLACPPSSMWMGHVAGETDSDVFLAFSRLGSRGWIRRGDETLHLLAGPDEHGSWRSGTSILVSERRLVETGGRPALCSGDPLEIPGRPTRPPPRAGTAASLTTTTLACRLAIETDYQLFTRFGDLAAEQAYLTQLFAAANAKYVEQVNTVHQHVYLALYTTATDPWVTPDIGGDSQTMLLEFQTRYAGMLPNQANLASFLSGANLGGGIAYLDALCDSTYGFSVCGNLSGDTEFPIVQGPTNWDFVVFTHELGHNFGTPHTHDFCPPLDQCAPNGYFGSCQTQRVCIDDGTIMSYCHLCPGGMRNIDPNFHPACSSLMRSRAEASCFGAWCTGPTSYCPATASSIGVPGTMSGSGSPSVAANAFTLTAGNLPPEKTVLFFYGPNQVQVAQAQGFRCVGGHVYRLRPAVSSGPGGSVSRLVDFTSPPAGSGTGKIEGGTTWNFQAYYRDPSMGNGGYNFTDAIAMPFCP